LFRLQLLGSQRDQLHLIQHYTKSISFSTSNITMLKSIS
jgi:hypothetical protein